MSHKGSLAEIISELDEELPQEQQRHIRRAVRQAAFHRGQPHEIEALVTEHIDLANRLAWSLLNRWRVRLGEDDVRSATGAALCEAASRFDSSRGVSFRTFLFYHLRGVLLKEISKRVNEHRMLVQEEVAKNNALERATSDWALTNSEQLSPEQALMKEELAELCRRACAQLDVLEQKIIFRFFVLDQSVVEIARELGYCRCHISRIKSQVLNRLARMLHHLSDVEEAPAHRHQPEMLRARKDSLRGSYTGGRGRRKRQAA